MKLQYRPAAPSGPPAGARNIYHAQPLSGRGVRPKKILATPLQANLNMFLHQLQTSWSELLHLLYFLNMQYS